MALGAAATGARVMVSTSSPGFSLMAEGMSYIAASELPVVLVNVMRGGPGLGSIAPAQADYLQAVKGHGHGDYRVPVLAPSSIAEAIALVADAFEIAERYRTPVIILADGIIGQAMEPVRPIYRNPPRHVDDWALTGADGRPPRVAKSLHLRPEDLEQHNLALAAKFRAISAAEVRWAGEALDDAELVIVAYGTAARVGRTAVARATRCWPSGRPLPPDQPVAVPVRRARRDREDRRGRSSSSSCRPDRWSRTSASRSRAGRPSCSTAGPAGWSRHPMRWSTRCEVPGP